MAPGARTSDTGSGLWRQTLLACAGGLIVAIVLWGGYSHHWPWVGINGRTATLWDWLHLLLLPLVCAILPVWLRRDTRMHPRLKLSATVALSAFGAVVLLGYVVPWAWTGFRGNTLWDWFNLVFLPLSLVLIPRFVELRRERQRRHTVVVGVILALFVAVVACGYLAAWHWTGFTGNTLWKWMNLLFLPLLVPTLIVPALAPLATSRVIYLDEHGNPIDGPPPAPPGEAGEVPAPTAASTSRS